MSLRVGSGLPNIQKSALSQFKITYPPKSEQLKIGEIARVADTKIARLGIQLGALKEQKSALIQQLLTGKRRVKLPSAQEEAA
jgi:type I restriction enzyme, S subunit